MPITEGDPAETLPLSTLTAARSCKRFLAENAKSARSFLKSCGHPVAIAELEIIEIGHEPDPAKFSEWLSPVKDGTDTAIVSESGCPAVADPGAGLVKFAQTLGLEVVPFVGPSSILLTLMASGMNGQRFRFLGYLPVHEETELFIETPYRNNRILEALATTLAADTRITAATDVTGREERIETLTAREWQQKGYELPKLPTVFAVQATFVKVLKSAGHKKTPHKPVRAYTPRHPAKR